MGIPVEHYPGSYRRALLFGILGGLAGVLLDLDHGLTIYFPEIFGKRPLHTLALIIACCVILLYVSCAGRLLFKMVLKRKDNE